MISVCSWDVGIKNLAYCIVHKTGDHYEIKKWDIINLVKDDDKYCVAIQKNKKVCGRRARYYGTVADSVMYYCGSHKKHHRPYKPGWENAIMNPIKTPRYTHMLPKKKPRCTYVLPKKKQCCGKRAYYIDKSPTNEYCCNAHRKLVINRIKKEGELKKIKRKKCTMRDHQFLAETMCNELDKIKELLT